MVKSKPSTTGFLGSEGKAKPAAHPIAPAPSRLIAVAKPRPIDRPITPSPVVIEITTPLVTRFGGDVKM